MAVTLKQLRALVALAETGSFVGAARNVHVSQPALSLQIKELEASLDARLVERLPRELRFTRAGEEALAHARLVLAGVSDLEQAVRWRRGLTGHLTLGVIPTVAPYLLPLALTRLRARNLALDIRVREAQTAILLDELETGRLDAIVVALPVEGARLTVEPLFEDRFLLAGTEARIRHWRDDPEAARPNRIAPDQLLLLDEGHCLADQALAACGLTGRRRRIDLGASSLATLTGLVAEGLGLTFVPEIAVRAECAARPGLTLVRFSEPQPGRSLALCRRSASAGTWVEELAGVLREAGAELTSAAGATRA